MPLVITHERKLTPEEFVDILRRSTLGGRRPVDDAVRMAKMLAEADVLCTAWLDGKLVGVARSLTDFTYCCYLSDLAVDVSVQRQGIGKALIEATRARLEPECMIVLLAAPAAREYYPHIGFDTHPSAWVSLGAKKPA